MRTLIAAVVMLLATLLSVECASAQVVPERARTVASAEAPSTPVAQHPGAAEDDCRPRHGARHSVSVPTPTPLPGHVCGCDSRTGRLRASERSVTVRESAPKARSVGLPLLHQTFRC
jgi:hypothetical protein